MGFDVGSDMNYDRAFEVGLISKWRVIKLRGYVHHGVSPILPGGIAIRGRSVCKIEDI
jgi:hypothetical protein